MANFYVSDIEILDHTPSFSEFCGNVDMNDMIVKHKCGSIFECDLLQNSNSSNYNDLNDFGRFVTNVRCKHTRFF